MLAKRYIGIIIFALVFIAAGSTNVSARDSLSWITAKNNTLIKDGESFKFIGANAVNLVFYDNWGLDVQKAIIQAGQNNISVLRLYLDWGWSKDEDFDKIIDIASKNGIYLILVFTDCCCSSNYNSTTKYFEVHAPFCNVASPISKAAFKRRIKQIIYRKNAVNGRIYRDEPAILAWEVANELEYRHFAISEARDWVKDIAGFIKALDKNHLVTIGIATNPPDSDQKNTEYGIFNIQEIDFISFHFYPAVEISKAGGFDIEEEYTERIKSRVRKFLNWNKPVIMGEFGFSNSTDTNRKFRTKGLISKYNDVYQKSIDAAFGSGASGVMFWGWGLEQEKDIPMWWSKESHSVADKEFCSLIRGYKVPSK